MKNQCIFFLIFYFLNFVPQNAESILQIPKCCNQSEVFVNNKCQNIPSNLLNFEPKIYDGENVVDSYEHKVVPLPTPNCQPSCANLVVLDTFFIQKNCTLSALESTVLLGVDKYCIEQSFTTEGNTITSFSTTGFFIALWCYDDTDVSSPPPEAYTVGNYDNRYMTYTNL